MKKLFVLSIVLLLGATLTSSCAKETVSSSAKIILLVSEQNIEGPQRAWWASEVDLSSTEATIASMLIQEGYEVLEPSNLNRVIKQRSAFRRVAISEGNSVKLGNLARADYVVLGKAVASAGGNIPQSSMISCFANLSAKLIRVKDGKVIAYLDGTGTSAHMDRITGGREALIKASRDLGVKLINALNKQGGK